MLASEKETLPTIEDVKDDAIERINPGKLYPTPRASSIFGPYDTPEVAVVNYGSVMNASVRRRKKTKTSPFDESDKVKFLPGTSLRLAGKTNIMKKLGLIPYDFNASDPMPKDIRKIVDYRNFLELQGFAGLHAGDANTNIGTDNITSTSIGGFLLSALSQTGAALLNIQKMKAEAKLTEAQIRAQESQQITPRFTLPIIPGGSNIVTYAIIAAVVLGGGFTVMHIMKKGGKKK